MSYPSQPGGSTYPSQSGGSTGYGNTGYGNTSYGNTDSQFSNQPQPNASQYPPPVPPNAFLDQWNKQAEWGRKNGWKIACIIIVVIVIANIPNWIRIHNEIHGIKQEDSLRSKDWDWYQRSLTNDSLITSDSLTTSD